MSRPLYQLSYPAAMVSQDFPRRSIGCGRYPPGSRMRVIVFGPFVEPKIDEPPRGLRYQPSIHAARHHRVGEFVEPSGEARRRPGLVVPRPGNELRVVAHFLLTFERGKSSAAGIRQAAPEIVETRIISRPEKLHEPEPLKRVKVRAAAFAILAHVLFPEPLEEEPLRTRERLRFPAGFAATRFPAAAASSSSAAFVFRFAGFFPGTIG